MRQSRVQRAIIHQSFRDVVIDKKAKKLLKHLMKQKPSKPENCTDEEIQEYFNDKYQYINWPAQWDCSGQLFTVGIDWKRNPNGMVSYTHTMALDV